MLGQRKAFSTVEVIIVIISLVLVTAVIARVLKSNDEIEAPNTQANENVAEPEEKLSLGFSLSPRSYQGNDFSDFFETAVQYGSVISWAGPWTDLEGDGSAAEVVAGLANEYGYETAVITSTHREVAGQISPIQPLTDENRQRFVGALADFADEYNPKYIGIGNEVNRIYDSDRQEYGVLVEWFSQAAAAVKESSPDTVVFTVFQYENLNGLNGGLFGGTNDQTNAQWQLLDDFALADMIGFTTYPYLIYQHPDDIPEDYYSRIARHTAKPVVFTEVGWPAGTEAEGYDSTPAEQEEFLSRFFELTEAVDLRLAIWPFLYDQGLDPPFSTVYLIDSDDGPLPALDSWELP